MSVQSYLNHRIPSRLAIHHVAMLRPFNWLSQAWQDIHHHPKASLAHGLAVSSLLFITLVITNLNLYVIAAAISGFMLIGPILAAGLCELSRRNEQGESVSFDDSLAGLSEKQHALIQFTSILLSFTILWFLVSGLALQLTLGSIAPPLEQTLWDNFLDRVTPTQLLLYTIIGGLLALVVFVVSVVSVPAIIENNVPAAEAMALSIKVTMENLPTMLVWALLIVILTAIGFMTFLLGMIVVYPLLGHATWHAYRDLVENHI